MIYRELGPSGIKISAVGFGAWAIGGWMWGGADENQAIDAIHAALDHGVNLIDTAPIYGFGRSEEIVGRAIRGRRESVVLATKCGMVWDREQGDFFFHANEEGVTLRPSERKVYKCLRPDSIREEIERSLRRLDTDHVDLYQTHWQESTTPIADTMAALTKLKDEGKIRAIGVCNASREHLKAYGPIDSDQEKYSMIDREIETNGVLAHCRRQSNRHAGLFAALERAADRQDSARPAVRSGRLAPRQPPLRSGEHRAHQRDAATTPADGPSATKRSIPQLVIAWTFSQPGLTCALCGARDAQQAIENAAAGGIQLSPAELEAIGTLVAV